MTRRPKCTPERAAESRRRHQITWPRVIPAQRRPALQPAWATRRRAAERSWRAAANLFVLGVLCGCSGSTDVCYVEGTVTYAGQEVRAGLIELEPADGSSQAYAIPIQAGRYETPSTMRIAPGTYVVRIAAPDLSTSASTASVGPNDPVAVTKPLLPASWNEQSTLRLQLDPGTTRASFRGDASPEVDVERL